MRLSPLTPDPSPPRGEGRKMGFQSSCQHAPGAGVARDLGACCGLHLSPPFLPVCPSSQAALEVEAQEAQLVGSRHSGVIDEAGVQSCEVLHPTGSTYLGVEADAYEIHEPDACSCQRPVIDRLS